MRNNDCTDSIRIPEQLRDDFELAGRNTPKVGRVWQDVHLRLLIAGESGTGKTTFIENLFHAYRHGKEPSLTPHSREPTSTRTFFDSPDELCTQFMIEVPEERIGLHYAVQDTPGYGDTFDCKKRLSDIIRFIEVGRKEYMALERTLMTDTQPDPRVDVCLYFIPPHRLKQIDIEFMRK